MSENPCRACDLLEKDKNNEVCKKCEHRINYLLEIGDATLTDSHNKSIYRRTFKRWEPWELDFLKKNRAVMSDHEIAQRLSRTESSVRLKVHRIKKEQTMTILPEKFKNVADRLVFDLCEHSDLWDSVSREADKNFRSLKGQVLAILSAHTGESKEKNSSIG